MPLLRIFGMLTLFCVVAGGFVLFSNGDSYVFVDTFTFAFVVFGVFGILLVGCEPDDWTNSVRVVLRRPVDNSTQSLGSAARFFKLASRGAISTGVISMLFNLISIFSTLADYSSIGQILAFSLPGLLYGLMLSEFVFAPLQSIAERRSPRHKNSDSHD